MPAESCTDDGYCAEGAGECAADSDCFGTTGCVLSPECVGVACVANGNSNGSSCSVDADCCSAHCQNGFCCDMGDCCHSASDCGEFYALQDCDNAITCQGSRLEARCTASQCTSSEAIDDDSACASDIMALQCFAGDVYCTGEADQVAPACAGDNGSICGDDGDCKSAHCENGFCCDSGDCCSVNTDCPAFYQVAGNCYHPLSCQGERIQAQCVENICALGTELKEDDSPCTDQIFSEDCGSAPDVYCTGEVEQIPSKCVSALSLTHLSNEKAFKVTYTKGYGNDGLTGCQLQYSQDGETWLAMPGAYLNCDQDAVDVVFSLPPDEWVDDWSTPVSVRVVLTETNRVRGIFAETLGCTPKGVSDTPTFDVDEDCDGEWNNRELIGDPIYCYGSGNECGSLTPGASYTLPETVYCNDYVAEFEYISWTALLARYSDAACVEYSDSTANLIAQSSDFSGDVPECGGVNGGSTEGCVNACFDVGSSYYNSSSTTWNMVNCRWVYREFGGYL